MIESVCAKEHRLWSIYLALLLRQRVDAPRPMLGEEFDDGMRALNDGSMRSIVLCEIEHLWARPAGNGRLLMM